jgi:hypothetical protein
MAKILPRSSGIKKGDKIKIKAIMIIIAVEIFRKFFKKKSESKSLMSNLRLA